MNSFSYLFLALLGLSLLTQWWLGVRHIAHIRAHRQSVPRAFKGKIKLSAHKKAADYTISKTRFGLVHLSIDSALLVVWTLGGGFALLDRIIAGWGLGPLWTGTVFFLLTFLIIGLLDLPARLFETFDIEERFGFNRTTAGVFFTDLIKQLVLLALIGTPLIFVVLWLMQETGQYWWLTVWLVWTGFSLVLWWIYPTLIAPLFNKFTPLEDGAVKKRVQALLRRAGFKSRGVFVMDGSRRSAHGNAYFTGFGKTKRVVFFDTLLKSLSDKEIEAVLAHELGHFKRRHIIQRMLMSWILSLAGLALLGWLMTQAWFFQGLGIDVPSTHTALMLFLMVAPVFTFFLSPIFALASRRQEFEADAYAAEHADARQLVSALVKLYEDNASTLTPDPIHSAFYDSHPPAAIRIQHLQALGT